jgi:nucleotide-binding universal stress UspA family protein
MFKKILVPLDGSHLSARALPPAMALARETGSRVILLSVPVLKHMLVLNQYSGSVGFLLPENSLRDSRLEMSSYLDTVAGRYQHPDLQIETQVVDGDEAGVIVDVAAREEVDLIVMSTHGRTGLQHWLLGSVTERVLQDAPCPVLIIRGEAPISRIILPLDGSKLAEKALDPGLEIAGRLGARATLLTVLHDDDLDAEEILRLEKWEAGLGEQLKGSMLFTHERYLQGIVRDYGRRVEDLQVQIQISLTRGSVAKRILAFAQVCKADLLVMATHGRTGIRRWLYGSVTEKVLRGARCHMLIVRPDREE